MSIEAYSYVISLRADVCSPIAFRVLAYLADHADELGQGAWGKKSTLAASLGRSPRTIQRAYRELLDADLIELGDQDHPRMKAPKNRRETVYNVLTPALRAKHEREQAAGPRGDTPVSPGHQNDP